MSFSAMKTVDQLVRIAAASGGFTINAKKLTVDQMVRIAAAASTNRAQISIADATSLTVDQAVRIGAAGKGCVVFID